MLDNFFIQNKQPVVEFFLLGFFVMFLQKTFLMHLCLLNEIPGQRKVKRMKKLKIFST